MTIASPHNPSHSQTYRNLSANHITSTGHGEVDTKDFGLHTFTAEDVMKKYGKEIDDLRETVATGRAS